jgi:hypothetical protein
LAFSLPNPSRPDERALDPCQNRTMRYELSDHERAAIKPMPTSRATFGVSMTVACLERNRFRLNRLAL